MPTQRTGLIAILDALGASTYSDFEIERFLESREQVLNKLDERAKAGKIDPDRLKVFTFNDTLVIVYLAQAGRITLEEVVTFCLRVRALMMHSLRNAILFRGAISVGRFFCVDDDTNTVMGAAVSDAAAWYDKADWIGINTTPHATMFIDSLLELSQSRHKHILVDYDVPLKGGARLRSKAINWPKGFFVVGLRPSLGGSAKAMLLTLLCEHQAPRGTESKYFNTITFFDQVVDTQQLNSVTE